MTRFTESNGGFYLDRRRFVALGAGAALSAAAGARPARAADAVDIKLAFEGPVGTTQEMAANIFHEALDEVSGGALTLTLYPGAQLGAEPTLLRKLVSGDIDMIISSTANASQLAPQSGVFSLHYLFSEYDKVAAALQDATLRDLYVEMAKSSMQGATPLTLFTLPLRHFFTPKQEIKSVADLSGRKVRVQATKTEDAFFAAYGAIPIHMPFTEVYTSLQTGVIDMAENAITYYASFKLYEVAPVMSLSQHEGNFQVLWLSDKARARLNDEQLGWLQAAAATVSADHPARAAAFETEIRAKYEALGVLFNEDVDKQSFIDIAVPLQDKLAAELGPHATKILERIRELNA